MTPVEAQKIMLTNIELEVPFLGSKVSGISKDAPRGN